MEQKPILAKWTRATFFGWLMGIVCILLLASLFHAAGIERMQFFVGTGIGAGVGFMQWRVLKTQIGAGHEWIWATMAGTTLPFLVSDGLKFFTERLAGENTLLQDVVLSGLIVGVLQQRILRRYFSLSVLWIGVSVLAWFAAGGTVMAVEYTKVLSSHNMVVFGLNLGLILSGGAVLGFISGIAVRRLFLRTAG